MENLNDTPKEEEGAKFVDPDVHGKMRIPQRVPKNLKTLTVRCI